MLWCLCSSKLEFHSPELLAGWVSNLGPLLQKGHSPVLFLPTLRGSKFKSNLKAAPMPSWGRRQPNSCTEGCRCLVPMAQFESRWLTIHISPWQGSGWELRHRGGWSQVVCLAGYAREKMHTDVPMWVPAVPLSSGSPRSFSVGVANGKLQLGAIAMATGKWKLCSCSLTAL